MLELRPTCECCATPLPPDGSDARICSFECTFCAPCADRLGACPNCGGELGPRPRRDARWQAKHPLSTRIVQRAEPCFAE